jgi:hypothetical protein
MDGTAAMRNLMRDAPTRNCCASIEAAAVGAVKVWRTMGALSVSRGRINEIVPAARFFAGAAGLAHLGPSKLASDRGALASSFRSLEKRKRKRNAGRR